MIQFIETLFTLSLLRHNTLMTFLHELALTDVMHMTSCKFKTFLIKLMIPICCFSVYDKNEHQVKIIELTFSSAVT